MHASANAFVPSKQAWLDNKWKYIDRYRYGYICIPHESVGFSWQQWPMIKLII